MALRVFRDRVVYPSVTVITVTVTANVTVIFSEFLKALTLMLQCNGYSREGPNAASPSRM